MGIVYADHESIVEYVLCICAYSELVLSLAVRQ
jgi:hypothetical protein